MAAVALAGTVAGDSGARCMETAREEAVALLSPGEQAAGVPATAAPISPAAAITVAGKATSPQNTDAHLTSRDFPSGPVQRGRGGEVAGGGAREAIL